MLRDRNGPLGLVVAAAFIAICTLLSYAFLFGALFGSTSPDKLFSVAGWLLVAALGTTAWWQTTRRASNAATTITYWGAAAALVGLGLPLLAAPQVSVGAVLLSGLLIVMIFFAIVWPLSRYVRKHAVGAA
jgi:hypothetical protein